MIRVVVEVVMRTRGKKGSPWKTKKLWGGGRRKINGLGPRVGGET